MDTRALIETLAADNRRTRPPVSQVWWGAAALAAALAASVFFAALGPRPDIEAAAETPRFLLKFVITLAMAAGAFGLVRTLSRPGASQRQALTYLLAGPALLALAVVVELAVVPPEQWAVRAIGTNSMVCLVFIPLIGVGPLALFLLALRYGAPTRPALAGAVAGLLAGGIAATFYAAHCTDDSPLFVATWYTLAVGILAGIGAIAAFRIARW
jgi:hypothetical protein